MKLPHTLSLCVLFLLSGTLYGMEGWMTDLEKAKRNSWTLNNMAFRKTYLHAGPSKKHLKDRFALLTQDYLPDHLIQHPPSYRKPLVCLP